MPIIKVPGKLMLAGEWAILEPGNSCIVMAVDKYVTATIDKMDPRSADYAKATPACDSKPGEALCEAWVAGMTNSATILPATIITFNLPDLGLPPITATYHDGQLVTIIPLTSAQTKLFAMCKTATEMALEFIGHAQPFTLTLTSDISNITMPDGSKRKLGFGSSAAAVVATIKAILAFYGYDITTPETLGCIFKLAVLAHYTAQGNCGSGFDIAAATYGTTLVYQRFNPVWITQHMLTMPPAILVTHPWPDLKITPIKLPPQLVVLVGFSGTSANTSALIATMNTFKQRDPQSYAHITTSINDLVNNLARDLTTNNIKNILSAINNNRTLLTELEHASDITLETPALSNLVTIAQAHGAAAKFSGAGGGDCGIALCTDANTAEKIKQTWQAAGIIPIAVKIL